VQLNPSTTELTTAATDAALGSLCLWVLLWLRSIRAIAAWKKLVWGSVFALLVLASALGTLVHGLQLSESVRAIAWQPLYLSLGLAVAFFLVGGIGDWRGEATARVLFPWAIGLGVSFFAMSWLFGGAFVIFVVYEVSVMMAALAIFLFLTITRRLPGAGMVALGIGLSLVAAGIQVSQLRLRVIVPFDHNGLFHIVQLIATAILAHGLRLGVAATGHNIT
jgi:hypothetical protein